LSNHVNAVLRPSRFHTEKGQFAIRGPRDAADAAHSLITAVLRVGLGYLVPKPWIASNAFDYLRARLGSSTRVFEWGAGMSTVWYDRNFAEVHSVEDDPEWHRRVQREVARANLYLLRGRQYVEKIYEFPAGYFDLISADGRQRCQCCKAALSRLRTGGLLLVDNTDKDRTTRGDMYQTDQLLLSTPGLEVRRFVGWAPGSFAPQETTVCTRLPNGGWRIG